jgi:hypothetical protein
MKSLKWSQVNAWRLAQHGLSPRLEREKIVEAVRRTGGIQAQLMSAAEMAIGVRLDGLTPQEVRSTLWQERTLVKTWAMRGTLHLLPSEDIPLYAAARRRPPLGPFEYYENQTGWRLAKVDPKPEQRAGDQGAATALPKTGHSQSSSPRRVSTP